jgi:hypothetical protein
MGRADWVAAAKAAIETNQGLCTGEIQCLRSLAKEARCPQCDGTKGPPKDYVVEVIRTGKGQVLSCNRCSAVICLAQPAKTFDETGKDKNIYTITLNKKFTYKVGMGTGEDPE